MFHVGKKLKEFYCPPQLDARVSIPIIACSGSSRPPRSSWPNICLLSDEVPVVFCRPCELVQNRLLPCLKWFKERDGWSRTLRNYQRNMTILDSFTFSVQENVEGVWKESFVCSKVVCLLTITCFLLQNRRHHIDVKKGGFGMIHLEKLWGTPEKS